MLSADKVLVLLQGYANIFGCWGGSCGSWFGAQAVFLPVLVLNMQFEEHASVSVASVVHSGPQHFPLHSKLECYFDGLRDDKAMYSAPIRRCTYSWRNHVVIMINSANTQEQCRCRLVLVTAGRKLLQKCLV